MIFYHIKLKLYNKKQRLNNIKDNIFVSKIFYKLINAFLYIYIKCIFNININFY